MDAAIHQAFTTALILHGTTGSPTILTIPWTNFYNISHSKAKLLDSARCKQVGRCDETNQANRNNNGTCGNQSNKDRNAKYSPPIVAYTGPHMVMRSGMCFSSEDWVKATKAQKAKSYEF
jgi:hypothetical protein